MTTSTHITISDHICAVHDAAAELQTRLGRLSEAWGLSLPIPDALPAKRVRVKPVLSRLRNRHHDAEDYDEAARLYRLAADQGLAQEAQCNLGWMYHHGKGVPKDYDEATRLYRAAADQGYAKAQYNLGAMYEFGDGVWQDSVEAARWYRLAAEQDYAKAQYSLGIMYKNGHGVAQDDAEAARWMQMAAERGE
jgi:TPR repeat protein